MEEYVTPSFKLLNLPDEVLLIIASLLDVPAIISLRKTCKYLTRVSHDRSLWLSVLYHQKYNNLPLPPRFHDLSWLSGIEVSYLEQQVIAIHRTHYSWLLARDGPARQSLQPKVGQCLLSLNIFLDKWLLCVYAEGSISLWEILQHETNGDKYCDLESVETHQPSPVKLRMTFRRLDWRGERGWSSCIAAVEQGDRSLILACSKHEGPSTTSMYRISLQDHLLLPNQHPTQSSIQEVAELSNAAPHVIRAIAPNEKLVAFSRGCYIDVVNWETRESVVFSTETEDLDELWNGVVALRFFPPYILCMRTRSVELYPIPRQFYSSAPRVLDWPIIKHHFPHTTFRDVSISALHITSQIISILAYDVLHGLFHYHVSIPHPDTSPSDILGIDIKLVGTYSMSQPPPQAAPHTPRPASGTTRGFVSACCIGREGKRGIWVERGRGSTRRGVVVFQVPSGLVGSTRRQNETTERNENIDDGNPYLQVANETLGTHTPAIDGRVVYEIGSYDLREDLTHCTFSEVTGRIALGNRSGNVIVL